MSNNLESYIRWGRVKVGKTPIPVIVYTGIPCYSDAYLDTRLEGYCIIFYATEKIYIKGYIDKMGVFVNFKDTILLFRGDILNFKLNQRAVFT